MLAWTLDSPWSSGRRQAFPTLFVFVRRSRLVAHISHLGGRCSTSSGAAVWQQRRGFVLIAATSPPRPRAPRARASACASAVSRDRRRAARERKAEWYTVTEHTLCLLIIAVKD